MTLFIEQMCLYLRNRFHFNTTLFTSQHYARSICDIGIPISLHANPDELLHHIIFHLL